MPTYDHFIPSFLISMFYVFDVQKKGYFFSAHKYFILFPLSDLPSRKSGTQKVGSSDEHGEPAENGGHWLLMPFA